MPREVEVKSVLNKSKRRDSWFLSEYTINPYSGCGFNCLYCYIRGSKYGSNLEQSLSVKTNFIEILERQLYNRAKKGEYGIIVLASATDPYLKIEKDYKLTRQALEVILNYRFPVHILTKGTLIERDFDLLHKIDQTAILPEDLKGRLKQGTIFSYSFSTLDVNVGEMFEKGAPLPYQRLKTLQLTLKKGFLTGVSLMPLIPWISDTTESLEHLFSTFKAVGVDYVLPASITLFGNSKSDNKTLMYNAIQKYYPHLAPKYERYFQDGTEMPEYYTKALHQKFKSLLKVYRLRGSILE